MTRIETFWMKNKEWYFFDEDGAPHMSDKAPPEAIKSFEKYKTQLEEKKDIL